MKNYLINKALIIADLHIGLNTDSYYIKGIGNSRLDEQKNTLEYIVDYLLKNEIDNLIIAGDIYDTSNPNAVSEFGFNSILNRLISNGKRIYILQGNHDYNVNGYGSLHPLIALFGDDDNIKIIDSVCTIGNIIFIPHCNINKAQDYTDYISSVAIADKPKYLIGHFHAFGARTGYERSLLSNGEYTIGQFPESVELAILGHIHKPQEFKLKGVQTVYVGSTQKNDISENDDEKRFIVIDFNTGIYESVPITTCINYGIVKIMESEINIHDWSKYKNQIMHIEISNYTGQISRAEIKSKLHISNLIKTIKFEKEGENKIKANKENQYKNLSFNECISKFFNNPAIEKIAANYLEKAYDTKAINNS